MIRKLFVSTMLVAGSLAALPAQALSTLAYWDTLGQPGNQATSPGAGSANVTASSIARGPGLTASAATNSFAASGWNAGEYFSLGFTVGSGYQVSLASLDIGTRSSTTGPGTMGLYYSGNGYSTALATFNQAPGSNFVNTIVDLSALTNLVGTVEFRIGMIAGAAANGGAVPSAAAARGSSCGAARHPPRGRNARAGGRRAAAPPGAGRGPVLERRHAAAVRRDRDGPSRRRPRIARSPPRQPPGRPWPARRPVSAARPGADRDGAGRGGS